MTTIRALMLAQQQRHSRYSVELRPSPRDGLCQHCGKRWPCADRVAADAVIATLDACDWQYDKQRLVPDQEASS